MSTNQEDWLAKTLTPQDPLAPVLVPKDIENNPSKKDQDNDNGEIEQSIDVHFEPVIQLPIIETKTSEEEETVFYKTRAKLFRYDKSLSQWKERGTGEMKLLQHSTTQKIRILMRRDQTWKICANHLILPQMKLLPNVGSDKSWVWNTPADISDGEPQPELLAIRFGTPEIAKEFQLKFEEAQKINASCVCTDEPKEEASNSDRKGSDETCSDPTSKTEASTEKPASTSTS